MNLCIFCGRLIRDLEKCTSANGTDYVQFQIAVNGQYIKGKEQKTEYINLVAFGKTADTLCTYLKKGSLCLFKTRYQKSSFTDKEGNKKDNVNFYVEEFNFFGGKNSKDKNDEDTIFEDDDLNF